MKRKKYIIMATIVAIIIALIAYPSINNILHAGTDSQQNEEEMEKVNPVGPAFSADSAYAFVKAQCNFGPRSMNTQGHEQCKQWIIDRFQQLGCSVTTQQADLKGYDGTTLHATNIIASINPDITTRILLCAHWDSRPWADNDPDSANWRKPILAANDAASGVAVMLEIARVIMPHLAETKIPLGIDFVCFDAEDWGTPQWANVADEGNTWALGAQYFANNLPNGYKDWRYGILLDMVGGQGSRFYREGISMQYAPEVVKKVWRAARQAGFGSFFPKSDGGMITDDHVPLNQIANIPVIDIIPYYPDCQQSSFGPTWHTIADDPQHIDPQTLRAVGQTVIQVIFTEC